MEGTQHEGGISSVRLKIFSADVSHHQYGGGASSVSGGHAVWTCHIINTEEGVQYMGTNTAQGVAGGCIYLEE